MCIHGISKHAADEPIVRAGIETQTTHMWTCGWGDELGECS